EGAVHLDSATPSDRDVEGALEAPYVLSSGAPLEHGRGPPREHGGPGTAVDGAGGAQAEPSLMTPYGADGVGVVASGGLDGVRGPRQHQALEHPDPVTARSALQRLGLHACGGLLARGRGVGASRGAEADEVPVDVHPDATEADPGVQ